MDPKPIWNRMKKTFRSRSSSNRAPPDADGPSPAAQFDRPPSPVNIPVNQQQIAADNTIGFIGNTAITAVTSDLSTLNQSFVRGDFSAVSQSPTSAQPQNNQLHDNPVDFTSPSNSDHPPSSPINMPVSDQKINSTEKSESMVGETAIVVIKESLKLVKSFSDGFPPLKMVATGLVEIFDRIDAVKGAQTEATRLHEQVTKLEKMLEFDQGELPDRLKDRLDGLHRALEEKRVALEKKLDRSLATRIVFSMEDSQLLAQVVCEITFAIEVTTLDLTVRSNIEISKIYDNTVLGKLGHVTGAEFNREDRQRCTEGTRVSLLAHLLSWATAADSSNSSHVFWLNGMAGTGKTTLMETFCSYLSIKGILGASFFCSIKSKTPRRDVRAIFPSIAKTLAENHPHFRQKLVEVLGTCSDPFGMNLKDQYRTLILDPAEKTLNQDDILVIGIDALDECEDQEGTEMLLDIILDQKPKIPLRFFATSRPERRIREAFQQRHHSSLRLHDIEDDVVQADIALYLKDQLGGVRKLRQHYGRNWPPPEIGVVVERAGRLFVYASTIYKYISDRGDPVERLQNFSGLQSPVAVAVESIEKLYTFILSEAFTGIDDKEASRIWSCLSILVSARRPLSVSTYAKILSTKADRIRTALESLHSVIIVPDGDDQLISLYHASFPDYLATSADIKPAHNENTTRCFRFMNSELRLGISGAITSHRSNDDQALHVPVPAHLKYSCTAWGYLVLQLVGLADNLIIEDIQTQVESFLRSKFVYWLEVLSSMGEVPHASRLLHQLSQKVPASHSLKPILTDFLQFMTTFLDPIRFSAPHIYLSALPFAPPTSTVSKLFLPQFPSLPVIHQSTDNAHVQRAILQFQGHKDGVRCVAFSPDGKYIVSGSWDRTVRLWNIETGAAAYKPFEGHNDAVFSIAFSPDGKHIASGSTHTIKLWNIETGEATSKEFEVGIVRCPTSVSFTSDGKYIISMSTKYQLYQWSIETDEISMSTKVQRYQWSIEPDEIEYHKLLGSPVAFSPDGKYMVCVAASYAYDLQLWDVKIGGAPLKRFKVPTYLVCSVSFSPDGKYIVSGSRGGTIQLWNVETGEAFKLFKGHKDHILSVTFSPDGEYVVSGSPDHTVRLWNIKTGEAAPELYEGHADTVYSVSFSPDGKHIVSGSRDSTIRLWKIETDRMSSRAFDEHTGPITSISFSPNGKYIASGSEDCTIRVWNFQTGEMALQPFKGHTKGVTSVTFSPDGNYIVSGSDDGKTRLWDAKTGKVALTLFEEDTFYAVTSIPKFSPDGKHIASVTGNGSTKFSRTVRLWNVNTGEMIKSKPFRGEPSSISFSPDGKHIIASIYGTVEFWNVETDEMTPFKMLEENCVMCVAFSPDGKYIVAGSRTTASYDSTGIIQLWNFQTGGLEATSDPSYAMDPMGRFVEFSPDGKYIISSSYCTIWLWTVETDRLVSKSFKGHQNTVNSVSFSPDGKYFASGSHDQTIRIYNHVSAEQIHHDLRVTQPKFLHQYPTGSIELDEGWLKYPSGELMLWVPAELRLGLYSSGIVNIIGTHGTKIELSRFVHGTEWLKCQEPTPRLTA